MCVNELGLIPLHLQVDPYPLPQTSCISHTYKKFYSFILPAAGWQENLCFFLLPWRSEFVISVMQSRLATCPAAREPPPITTELLSLRTKIQRLCFKKDTDGKNGRNERWEAK